MQCNIKECLPKAHHNEEVKRFHFKPQSVGDVLAEGWRQVMHSSQTEAFQSHLCQENTLIFSYPSPWPGGSCRGGGTCQGSLEMTLSPGHGDNSPWDPQQNTENKNKSQKKRGISMWMCRKWIQWLLKFIFFIMCQNVLWYKSFWLAVFSSCFHFFTILQTLFSFFPKFQQIFQYFAVGFWVIPCIKLSKEFSF